MSSQQLSHVIRGRGSERSLVILSHAASRASRHSCVTFVAYTFITPYSILRCAFVQRSRMHVHCYWTWCDKLI